MVTNTVNGGALGFTVEEPPQETAVAKQSAKLATTHRGMSTMVPMPDRSRKRPADLNSLAASIVADSTDEDKPGQPEDTRDPAAVALGRRGGLKGGKARAAALTSEQRSEIARKAAAALARRGVTRYRDTFPLSVSEHNERGLASWIHDRMWTHAAALIDGTPNIVLRDKDPFREITDGVQYRVRTKRHRKEGGVRSYATAACVQTPKLRG